MGVDASFFNFILKYKSKGKHGCKFIGFSVNFRCLDTAVLCNTHSKQMKLLNRKYFTSKNIRGIHIYGIHTLMKIHVYLYRVAYAYTRAKTKIITSCYAVRMNASYK